jgi:vitamin B12 transporter
MPVMSMRNIALSGAAFAAMLLMAPYGTIQASEQDPPRVDDTIVVTASALGVTLTESLQSVTVIDRLEIEAAPAATLAELLDRVAGVDVRRRGAAGVQADIGIRGTAYEQTLLLLNGVPLRDPQTGHHDLNIPVPLEQIERIEVVRGPGGLAYGGNATGGLINIVTRQPGGTEIGAGFRAGSFATREGRGYFGRGGERAGHLFSVAAHHSDGHLSDSRSDSDLRQTMYSGHAEFSAGSLTWGLGAEDKAFGAWKFYTADFPDQREETTSRLAYMSGQTRFGDWEVAPRVFWRGHQDWFRTMVGEIAFINEHETDVHGVHFDARRGFAQGTFALGAGTTREQIESSALDDHRRSESSLWAAHRHRVGERISLEAGVHVISFSDHGSELLPSFGLGYRFSPHWRGFLSSARSARVPSWTEQHLLTAGNVGNPDLRPERSDYHEAGVRFFGSEHRLSAAVFERRTDRLIDWSRSSGEVAWMADNFDDHRTRGSDIEWHWRPRNLTGIQSLTATWIVLSTWLDDRGREIKYALDFPRRSWTVGGLLGPIAGVDVSLTARRVERASANRSTQLAVRAQRRFGAFQAFVEGSNLLDEEIIEAGFAPLPGRAVFAGLNWQFRD